MVESVVGHGLGLFTSSTASIRNDEAVGQGKLNVAVNTASGNLILSRQDQRLIGNELGLDVARTYNSQGKFADANANNFRFSFNQRLVSPLASGPHLTRITEDGFEQKFEKVDDHLFAVNMESLWVSTDGDNAHDRIYLRSHLNVGHEFLYVNGDGSAEVYNVQGTLIAQLSKQSTQRYLDSNAMYSFMSGRIFNGRTNDWAQQTIAELETNQDDELLDSEIEAYKLAFASNASLITATVFY